MTSGTLSRGGQSQGAATSCHLAVRAYRNKRYQSVEPEVTHQFHILGQIIVVCDNRATLKGIHEFGGMKAEDFTTRCCRSAWPFVRTAERHGLRRK